MQTLSFIIGNWRAEAQLEELEPGKLMAVISVTDHRDGVCGGSKHTIVFEHNHGEDKRKETEALVRQLLCERYGLE